MKQANPDFTTEPMLKTDYKTSEKEDIKYYALIFDGLRPSEPPMTSMLLIFTSVVKLQKQVTKHIISIITNQSYQHITHGNKETIAIHILNLAVTKTC
jgi:hypothetical protein